MSDTPASASASAGSFEPDPVIEAFKRDVDRTLLRENLRLTPEERVRRLSVFLGVVEELRRAGKESK